jgi:nitroreductase
MKNNMPELDRQEMLDQAMNWRYATKVFDPEKKISSENLGILKKSLILSPSSFGLQPYKFLFVESLDLRKQLTPHSWNQLQIEQADLLVVFLALNQIDEEYIDKFLKITAETRNINISSLAFYRKMMVENLINSEKNILEWSSRQSYIALANLMTTASLLKIDSCPIEGFEQVAYEKILKIDSSYNAVCVCALGYRSLEDKYQNLAKVRFSALDLIANC